MCQLVQGHCGGEDLVQQERGLEYDGGRDGGGGAHDGQPEVQQAVS